jgi:hypothetical protein
MNVQLRAKFGLLALALAISPGVWAAGSPALPEVPWEGVGVSHVQMRDDFAPGLGPVRPSAQVGSGNPGDHAVRLGPGNALVGVTLFPSAFGPGVCGTNGVAAACAFVDASNVPDVGYHYQGLFHRPLTELALEPYNFVGRDGFGNVYRVGIRGHNPGATLAFHLLTPPGVDGLPGGLTGQDIGIGVAGIWSRLPGLMDGNLWVGEGVIPNASMLAAGWTSFFNDRLWLRSYSDIEFVADGVDGEDFDLLLGGQSVQQFHPELHDAVVGVIPVPAAVWLLGSALAGLIGTAGRRRISLPA